MLENIKTRVIEIARRAQRDGLCKHKSGNFSMRDPETNYVVITPSGVDRELLTPEEMVVIDLDAHVIEYKKGIRPSSEVLMHLMIYKTCPQSPAEKNLLPSVPMSSGRGAIPEKSSSRIKTRKPGVAASDGATTNYGRHLQMMSAIVSGGAP